MKLNKRERRGVNKNTCRLFFVVVLFLGVMMFSYFKVDYVK